MKKATILISDYLEKNNIDFSFSRSTDDEIRYQFDIKLQIVSDFSIFYPKNSTKVYYSSIFEPQKGREINEEQLNELWQIFDKDKGPFDSLIFDESDSTLHLFGEWDEDKLNYKVLDDILNYLHSNRFIMKALKKYDKAMPKMITINEDKVLNLVDKTSLFQIAILGFASREIYNVSSVQKSCLCDAETAEIIIQALEELKLIKKISKTEYVALDFPTEIIEAMEVDDDEAIAKYIKERI